MSRFFLIVFALCLSLGIVRPAASQDLQSLFRDFRSSELDIAEKRFLQTALAFEGHYIGLLDGDWGPLSQRALNSYARAEFGTSAEEWHMAALAFGFFDLYERDGWGIRHFDILDLSFLYPYRAVASEPSTDFFVNWRHTNSSLAYSTGIHALETVQNLHNYTASTHDSYKELYELRRRSLAITSAVNRSGGVLYTRSNYVDGKWSTVMISADRQDVPIPNAVAASITVGPAPDISIPRDGKLSLAIDNVLAALSKPEQDEEAPEIPRQENASSSSGTGFIVSNQGHILTNAHVVNDCTRLRFNGSPTDVVAVSDTFDLALLQSDDLKDTAFATFSPSPARLNSDVTVVGYPLWGILSGVNVTRGAVSSQLGLGGEVAGMQITAPVQPGNSGGPVIASDGEVVGVVVSKLNAQAVSDLTGDIPQNVNFAIRGEIAKLFLFQHGVAPALGESDAPFSPTDLAGQATAYTGFIECL